jgi:hypothetical protein
MFDRARRVSIDAGDPEPWEIRCDTSAELPVIGVGEMSDPRPTERSAATADPAPSAAAVGVKVQANSSRGS